MGVRVQEQVKNSFFNLFGVKTQTFKRSAVAGYRVPLKLGSGSNVLGRETATLPQWGSSDVVGTSGFWVYTTANQFKDAGDRWGSTTCSSDPAHATDLCTGTSNDEYDPVRTYIVSVDAGYAGHLVVQSYDGGFYPVTSCNSAPGAVPPPDSHAVEAWNKYPDRPSYDPSKKDACADYSNNAIVPGRTTMQMLTGTGNAITECPSVTYDPLPADPAQSWVPLLTNTAPHSPGASYRNWDTICDFDIGGGHSAGVYKITVAADAGAKMSNAFSLRAAFMNGGSVDVNATTHVHVYAKDRIVTNVHDQQQSASLPIVQTNQATKGHTVTLEVFDMGDLAANGDVLPYFRLQPVGWNNLNSLRCRISSVKDSPYWSQPCELTNVVSPRYSGHVLHFEIEIPADATCDFTDPTKCWVVAQTNYGDDFALLKSDTVAYSLVDNGAPMRLYNASQYGF